MKVIPLYKNERQLIARVAKNNREAQQQLYKKFSGKMLSVCRMYTKDVQHAEEVMLNGFLKVFTHISDFKSDGSFEGWVRRIMIREAISFLRRQKKLEFQEEVILNESFNNIQSDIDVEHIQRLIDGLPEGYRVVFVMYAIEGYKHQEIAELLNITPGTSKSQLFKARKMLQEKLQMKNTSGYGTT
ncbi:DNA-directed RNA polymerase sigma-70 factor [Salinimicrobium marinum]|uniref:DNA-directed RNA polymerase sigma-70 factor n=1 Tax=Salinimicrobium marinum TaxID=680283 RepID=A0A918VV13_9FLAO|nr:RNA polymerase sigma factor [Salinimicrobium marinum]GHA26862.1 DNA-directed RNA polymerase sigma-70 factor [Salinimicrobium marinum]